MCPQKPTDVPKWRFCRPKSSFRPVSRGETAAAGNRQYVSRNGGKNLLLTRKMAHLSRRTIREKLISYFSEESSRQGRLLSTFPSTVSSWRTILR